jgi:hypothetical protein
MSLFRSLFNVPALSFFISYARLEVRTNNWLLNKEQVISYKASRLVLLRFSQSLKMPGTALKHVIIGYLNLFSSY